MLADETYESVSRVTNKSPLPVIMGWACGASPTRRAECGVTQLSGSREPDFAKTRNSREVEQRKAVWRYASHRIPKDAAVVEDTGAISSGKGAVAAVYLSRRSGRRRMTAEITAWWPVLQSLWLAGARSD